MQTLLDNMRRGALGLWVYKAHQAYLRTHSWLPFGHISLSLRAVLTLATHWAPSSLGKRTGCSRHFIQYFLFYSLIDAIYFLLLLICARERAPDSLNSPNKTQILLFLISKMKLGLGARSQQSLRIARSRGQPVWFVLRGVFRARPARSSPAGGILSFGDD